MESRRRLNSLQRLSQLTAFGDVRSEINVNSNLGAEQGVVGQSGAQTRAPAAAGLVATLLPVDVWTNVAVTRGEHATQEHLTLGGIEY